MSSIILGFLIASKNFAKNMFISPIPGGSQTRFGNNRWETFSPKLKRNVVLYSNLEHDHWALIECDSKVKTFCEQPLKVQVNTNAGLVTTIFDMWILWKSGEEEFREIKHESDVVNSKRAVRQIEAQQLWCQQRGLSHTIATEREVRGNLVYLNNCKQIIKYVSTISNKENNRLVIAVHSLLAKSGSLTIREVFNSFPRDDFQEVMASIAMLIYEGAVSSNIVQSSLNKETLLKTNDENR
ncbi:MAG TPA: Tn7 transposase TnsA N-terminal domain-containing protein [Pyrinomonadaceae bacterium]